MDSANSGSMQSSSGGDEDYDSRAESISAFLNNPPAHVGTFTSQHNHIHMLDPLSNYFDPNPNPNTAQRSPSLSNSNPLLNLDMAWSKPGRSTDLGALMPSSLSAQNQGLVSGQLGGQGRGGAFPAAQQTLPSESCSRGLLSVSGANDQAHSNSSNSNTVRNPKKRSRASRRAPTTVLTTDTTNFRAMVQEFTGIPAPPFTSSPFPRARLDLFSSSAPSSAFRSPHFDPPLPPYLLRPFPHKLHSPNPFLSPSSSSPMPSFPTTSSMVDPLPSNPATNSSTSINYQLTSDLGLLKQPPLNVNTMHVPSVLNFQSILQPPPKFPAQNSPSILAPKSQGSLEIPPSADSHLKMGVLEELGLTHAHVNANVAGLHRTMVSSSSDGAMRRRVGMAANNEGDDGSLVRSLGGANYSNTERVGNGIVNYLASSDNFHGEKGPECVAAVPRSEGMVESWINCSSD
ncbi:uncharacterized protein LOC129319321 isoform X2 [Prosopis cineraria]|uniref:uncharacterized protein LOC129319321 isoform X2 n=1 Tax=Prosopis cineraria TaxID=364024 RepID=UPI00240FBE8C|nr:uncharacterized protein LOC129319321 isoform X2 [Prosopis cineraria]